MLAQQLLDQQRIKELTEQMERVKEEKEQVKYQAAVESVEKEIQEKVQLDKSIPVQFHPSQFVEHESQKYEQEKNIEKQKQ